MHYILSLTDTTTLEEIVSYHERSAWACLIAILLVFAPYFYITFSHPMAFIGLFALAIIGLIVILVGFHVVNAITSTRIRKTGEVPSPDELDRSIEHRAAKLGGLVLAIVVLAWSIGAMYGLPMIGVAKMATTQAASATVAASDFVVPVGTAVFWVNVLFAGFVAANLVYYGKIVASYRIMANA